MQKLYIGVFPITIFLLQCTSAIDKKEVNWYKELITMSDDFAVLDTLNYKLQQSGSTIEKLHLYRERSRRYARAAPLIFLKIAGNAKSDSQLNSISKASYDSIYREAEKQRLRYLALSIADADTVIKYDTLDLYLRINKYRFLVVLGENEKALEEINTILKIVQGYKSRGENIWDIWKKGPWYSNSTYVPLVDVYSPTVCDVLVNRGRTLLTLGDTTSACIDFSVCKNDSTNARYIQDELKCCTK